MSIIDKVGEAPPVAKAAGVTGALTLGVGLVAWWSSNWMLALAIFAGAVAFAAVLIGIYRWFVAQQEKKKAKSLAEGLKENASVKGQSASAADRAMMDDAANKFEEGLSQYRKAGKDVYKLPWYMLVGPPGSGKTEAMRHCNVGFPSGLTDKLQGAGGTLSMHWWFTNNAVVIDTAGRLLMSKTNEWKEFLGLLKRARTKCPINGLLLAVDIETLIRDNAEQLEQKAGHIAQQLEVIQRVLDVRFPVFVIVTKCDRIVGFREFFETLNQPGLQHQIMGWSNPAKLDEPFQPELIDQHLRDVRSSLLTRRKQLLLDPVHTEDPSARRLDQADSFYAFPNALMQVAPRLRRFLETIFVAGEWSPKPLFLRGIYFTSSLQEGRALDEALAKALGVPVGDLPGAAVQRRERSLFLRDVFTEKVFKERGLVSSAGNVTQAMRIRRAAIMGGGIVAALAFMILSWIGGSAMQEKIVRPAQVWTDAGTALDGVMSVRGQTEISNAVAIIRPPSPGAAMAYAGDVPPGGTALTPGIGDSRLGLLLAVSKQSQQPLTTPFIFRPIAFLIGGGGSGMTEAQQGAARRMVEIGAVIPLVEQARARLANPETWQGPENRARASRALAELLRIETFASKSTPEKKSAASLPGVSEPIVDLAALVEVAVPDYAADMAKLSEPDRLARMTKLNDLSAALVGLYSPGSKGERAWPPASLRTGDKESTELVAAAIALFDTAWKSRPAELEPFENINTALLGLISREAELAKITWPASDGKSGTMEKYASASREWNSLTGEIATFCQQVDKQRAALGDKVEAALPRASERARVSLIAEFDRMLGSLPAPKGAPGADLLGEGKLAEGAAAVAGAIGGSVNETLAGYRTRLEAAKTASLGALTTRSTELGKSFGTSAAGDGPVAAMLAVPATGGEPLYKRRLVMYQGVATAAGKAPDASSIAIDLKAALEAAKVAVEQVSTSITPLDNALPPSAAREACVRALRSVQARRETDAIVAYMTAAASADFGAAVAERSKGFRRLSGLRLDAAWAPKLEPSQKFHPDGAKGLFEEWAALSARVEPSGTSAGTLPVLTSAELDQQYESFKSSARRYADQFTQHWRGMLTGAVVSPNAISSWADFRQAMATLDAGEVAADLRTLLGNVERGLKSLAAAPVWAAPNAESDLKVVGQQLASLENPDSQQKMADAVRAWAALDASQTRAFSAWNRKPSDFAVTAGTSRFFNSLTKEGERLLTGAGENMLGNALALVRSSAKFPLAKGTGESIAPADMAEIAKAAGIVADAAGTKLTEAEAKTVANIRTLAQSLSVDKATAVKLAIADMPDAPDNALRAFQSFRVLVNAEAKDPVFKTTNPKTAQPVTFALPGDSVTIELGELPDAKAPSATVSLPAPWNVLQPMLSAAGVERAGAAIVVPVPVTHRGQTYRLWVSIELTPPPMPGDMLLNWPTRANWPMMADLK